MAGGSGQAKKPPQPSQQAQHAFRSPPIQLQHPGAVPVQSIPTGMPGQPSRELDINAGKVPYELCDVLPATFRPNADILSSWRTPADQTSFQCPPEQHRYHPLHL